ncbi:CoA-binding protein [Stackebrandtia nassauensis]|uniref:CoA-binding domain protein n=1 Tax=Stackebrandtia nassauensis (strain DSM 44728 / CIP 108903 / NRRL B-16338 / NBRC 102104 / LLR-40K-21) TaxID=446470 RepID=D3Q2N5_STANL|nr:CoA-binding protein [Stackebrandtia nassauensis]ADD45786.1 CoA-binding domain protein [Stackebrandtia nassauensis DSM 44728]
MSSSISALWNARSIAVYGASDREGSAGGRVLDYLRAYGYTGRVIPVHPGADTVRGLQARPSLAGAEAELALLLVGAARIPAALDDCLDAGVTTVIVGASGFAETGAVAAQDALVARAAEAGARLLGPNCIGAANLHNGLIASFSPYFEAEPATPGGLALVSHSGGLGFGITSLAAERGLAPGRVVTTGNEADLSAGEVMCALAEEPDCTGVLAYLESTPDPKWLKQLHATGKPIAALYASATTASSTNAGGSEARVLPQFGIELADDVDELLDFASGFDTPPPAGPRLAIVTTSGGAGHLATKAVAGSGLKLPEPSAATLKTLTESLPPYATIGNPVDVTATVTSDPGLLSRTLATVAADDGFDAVLVCLCVLAGPQAEQAAAAVIDAASSSGKPILVSRTGSRELAPGFAARLAAAGIGVYPTPARAVAALCARRMTFRRR